jgi:hypothetical protein
MVCGLAAALVAMLLAGCGGTGTGAVLSDVRASTHLIVPGSSGVGEPAGALEVRYTLHRDAQVDAVLEGPVRAELLSEQQRAGEHVLRFNGVVSAHERAGDYTVVRKVVPDGDYTITISAEGTQHKVSFTVRGAHTDPPSLDNIVVHPDVISPNSDAVDDVSEVTFRTDQTATLSVELVAADGTGTLMLAPTEKGPGEHNVVVSGQDPFSDDPAGEILPDGTYTITIRAQDHVGNSVEAYRPLRIEGGGSPQIQVLRVEISPRQIMLGQAISVSITVKNVGKVPLRTQGPDPGYTYTTNDSYSSIEGHRWVDRAGLWRVGVDWDGNSGGGGPYRYPFRWGFGKTLMPGETVTTGGTIIVLKQERTMWFYAGVLQEGIRIVLDRLGRTRVDISF